MFKVFFKKLKSLFQEKNSNSTKYEAQTNCETSTDISAESETTIKAPTETTFSEFATNLSSALSGFSIKYNTPDEVINEYLSKYSIESLFEALSYIFGYNNKILKDAQTSCSLIRYYRDKLCELLLKLNITPINSWLKILSHNYNNELYYEDFTLKFLCENIPEDDLISFVLEDFDNILSRTEFFDYHYFSKYDAWKQKFSKNISEILKKTLFYSATDCLNLVKYFPDCAVDIYMFVLKKYYESLKSINHANVIWLKISIVDDVLQPLADYHTHIDNSVTNINKDFIIEFFTVLGNNFTTLLEAKKIFEENYNIDSRVLDDLINSNAKKYIDYLVKEKVTISKIAHTLNGLFAIPDAYNYFLDNLSALLHRQGIDLYCFLIKNFPINKTITNSEHCCFEYD